MENTDPRQVIAQSPMSAMQIVVVVLCICLNALDGFDVLAISFAAPGIAADWGIDRAALGIVLSMELIGMAAGSLMLGNLADRVGRRPIIVACLAVMSAGMYLACTAGGIVELSIVRLITGVGIGGILASVNAMVAEFSNAKRRHLAVTLMAAGYPLGAILGGSVVAVLLTHFDWRSIFLFGALITAIFLPVVWFFVPESVEYLAQKQPRRALERINTTLAKMGRDAIDYLPKIVVNQSRTGMGELFSPALIKTTLLLALAYFAQIMTFYFVLKWIPKIVVDMGFAASSAGTVLVWSNVGGIAGALLFSVLTQKFAIRKLVVGAMIASFASVVVFGHAPADLQKLSLYAALAGFFNNAAIVGMYAIFAHEFPTRVRAGGTGLVIGLGRGGAVLGPILPGFLFVAGHSLPSVAIVMAVAPLVSAVAIFMLSFRFSTAAEPVGR